ncbi:hypothetical protein THAOC_04635, partial [Thalassiosira oceanica]
STEDYASFLEWHSGDRARPYEGPARGRKKSGDADGGGGSAKADAEVEVDEEGRPLSAIVLYFRARNAEASMKRKAEQRRKDAARKEEKRRKEKARKAARRQEQKEKGGKKEKRGRKGGGKQQGKGQATTATQQQQRGGGPVVLAKKPEGGGGAGATDINLSFFRFLEIYSRQPVSDGTRDIPRVHLRVEQRQAPPPLVAETVREATVLDLPLHREQRLNETPRDDELHDRRDDVAARPTQASEVSLAVRPAGRSLNDRLVGLRVRQPPVFQEVSQLGVAHVPVDQRPGLGVFRGEGRRRCAEPNRGRILPEVASWLWTAAKPIPKLGECSSGAREGQNEEQLKGDDWKRTKP